MEFWTAAGGIALALMLAGTVVVTSGERIVKHDAVYLIARSDTLAQVSRDIRRSTLSLGGGILVGFFAPCAWVMYCALDVMKRVAAISPGISAAGREKAVDDAIHTYSLEFAMGCLGFACFVFTFMLAISWFVSAESLKPDKTEGETDPVRVGWTRTFLVLGLMLHGLRARREHDGDGS